MPSRVKNLFSSSFISIWSRLSQTKDRRPFSLDIPPDHHPAAVAHCGRKALKAGIPTMLFFFFFKRETSNTPTVQPLVCSQADQALD